MDQKTEELREMFLEVSDTDTVTESQAEQRGSLTEETSVDDELEELILEMQDRYEFRTDLSLSELKSLTRAVYDGTSDAEIARSLSIAETTVFKTRLDLHLLRDADTNAPFDFDQFRRALAQGASIDELADQFDTSTETIRHYRTVHQALDQSRRANDRYRDAFAELLADADLTDTLTDSVTEDGLEDATEGMETDVSF